MLPLGLELLDREQKCHPLPSPGGISESTIGVDVTTIVGARVVAVLRLAEEFFEGTDVVGEQVLAVFSAIDSSWPIWRLLSPLAKAECDRSFRFRQAQESLNPPPEDLTLPR